MDVYKLRVATVQPANVKNVGKLDSDETGMIELFKKKNKKVHMSVVITSNVLRPVVGVFDMSAKQIMICGYI